MKSIIKNFNNLVKKTIFKVKNKTNNNFNISVFNKCLITLIALLFFYLFYLLIPLLYDKTWIQTNIESRLLNEFKVNVSTSADISYRILPAPHFLIKDTKILVSEGQKKKTIAEIKYFQIFLSQKNFFDKEKMDIQKIVLNKANFSLLRSDLKFLSDLTNTKFSSKKIIVNKSNIFFKDNLKETVSIIKVNETVLFFDDKKLLNFLNLKGEIFNMPFTFNFNSRNDSKNFTSINFKSKSLKLNISNNTTTEKKLTYGKNIISILKSKINTNYSIKEKIINFESDNSRLDKSQIDYNGKLSINPFDLNANIYLNEFRISKLFTINSILIEFIKSGLLFNDNISVNTSIIINSKIQNEIFQNANINFHIINGKIHFDKTKFINNKIGSIEISNSNLFYKNNELIFNSDAFIDIKNSKNLFSFFDTGKASQKNFKTILINFEYNFFNNKIKFNDVKIDNNTASSEFLTVIDGLNDIDFNNENRGRKILNDLFKIYAG
tara:strand:+ start:728 stop:2209 length:1482 start_codon:yes stop_codon:yes gene_type:complete